VPSEEGFQATVPSERACYNSAPLQGGILKPPALRVVVDFRDAKQYWGLEDFLNVTPTGVTNAANLSLFMVNVSSRLLRDFRQDDPEYSILDLKAYCRGYKYVDETIKMLPEKPVPVLLSQILHKVAGLGRNHASQPSFSVS
jgi:hypothetical protein